MNLLVQKISCLLFVHSIEQINNIELTNHYHPNIVDVIKDFNFIELSTEEISTKKMPFINCNRKIFCNSDIN